MRKKTSTTKNKFVCIFLNDLDCVSRVPESYLGHSTTSSERDIDRVYGGKTGKSAQIAPESPKHPTSSGADYAFIQSQNASWWDDSDLDYQHAEAKIHPVAGWKLGS